MRIIIINIIEARKEIIGGLISGLLVGFFISVILPPLLTPKTDISVSCNRNKLNSMNFDFNFTNNAYFSGDNFKIFIYSDELSQGIISYNPPLGELCKEANKIAVDMTNIKVIGLSIGCEYIPPKSTIQFTLIPNKLINNTFRIEYWSKTTKFTNETKQCV